MAKSTRAPNGLDGVVGHEHGKSTSYIVNKAGIPTGDFDFNELPPGMDLNSQKNADIRSMPYRSLVDINGYGNGK